MTPDQDSANQDSDPTSDPAYERHETELAASEAAAIGGVANAGGERIDPAQRPLREAGGGEAEGFEEAEAALIDHASHGDEQPAHVILHDQGRQETDTLGANAEADHEHSSELDSDTPV